MTRYYLTYARRHQDDWQALDGAQFAQIRRGWAVASEGCPGLTADEQVNLIFGYLNALDGYLERRGLWAELLAWNQRALAAAQGIGNEALAGGLLNDIGLCHRHLGRYEEARDYFEQALAVRRRVGPVAGEAVTLNNLGLVHDDLGALAQAAEFYEQALPLRRAAGDRQGEGITLQNLATTLMQFGRWAEAAKRYEQALAIERAVGDRMGEAGTLSNLGQLYLQMCARGRGGSGAVAGARDHARDRRSGPRGGRPEQPGLVGAGARPTPAGAGAVRRGAGGATNRRSDGHRGAPAQQPGYDPPGVGRTGGGRWPTSRKPWLATRSPAIGPDRRRRWPTSAGCTWNVRPTQRPGPPTSRRSRSSGPSAIGTARRRC